MPNFTPSVTEDDLLTAVRAFLISVLPVDWEVVRGQDNRVPEPTSPNFVVMTPVNRSRLSTNVDTFSASTGGGSGPLDTTNYQRDTQADIQLDIHGPGGADGGQTIATLWRDDYAAQIIAPNVAPLYATDGHQMPFINAEQQYEDRWVMTLYAQINPIVSTTTQFADTVAVTIEVPIDAEAA